MENNPFDLVAGMYPLFYILFHLNQYCPAEHLKAWTSQPIRNLQCAGTCPDYLPKIVSMITIQPFKLSIFIRKANLLSDMEVSRRLVGSAWVNCFICNPPPPLPLIQPSPLPLSRDASDPGPARRGPRSMRSLAASDEGNRANLLLQAAVSGRKTGATGGTGRRYKDVRT